MLASQISFEFVLIFDPLLLVYTQPPRVRSKVPVSVINSALINTHIYVGVELSGAFFNCFNSFSHTSDRHFQSPPTISARLRF
jgi:hypothetical protein